MRVVNKRREPKRVKIGGTGDVVEYEYISKETGDDT